MWKINQMVASRVEESMSHPHHFLGPGPQPVTGHTRSLDSLSENRRPQGVSGHSKTNGRGCRISCRRLGHVHRPTKSGIVGVTGEINPVEECQRDDGHCKPSALCTKEVTTDEAVSGRTSHLGCWRLQVIERNSEGAWKGRPRV